MLRDTRFVRKNACLASPPYTSASAMLCHRTEPKSAAGKKASAVRGRVGFSSTYRRSRPASRPYRMGGTQKMGL